MTDDREWQRKNLMARLEDQCKATLEERVDRWMAVGHQGIIPSHHFAQASTECIELYRDGHFLSAVMVSHSVNEGLWRFVLERNGIQPAKELPELPELAADLVRKSIITQACADAFVGIWKSFRNDVHHMNPKVATIPFKALAEQNLARLAAIEGELFAVTPRGDGALQAVQAKYWDLKPDGYTAAYLRF